MKYILIISILLCAYSCNVCTKIISRTVVEIDNENLICQCSDLKKDSLIGKQLLFIHRDSSRYLVGSILVNSDRKGIYQYIKVGVGVSINNFIYYDGFSVHNLNKENLYSYADSLNILLGFDKKRVDKVVSLIGENLNNLSKNNSDVF